MRTRLGMLAFAGALAMTLSACGSDDGSASSSATSTPSSTTATASASAAAALTVTDPWVKAADSGMTAVFGEITNTTSSQVHIVSVKTSASARGELHEMAMVDGQMKMQMKPDGIRVPANGTTKLAPGGDHIMVMDLKAPVKAGDEVTVTLSLEGGQTVEFTAVAKPYTGANESYHSTATSSMTMSPGMTMKPTQ